MEQLHSGDAHGRLKEILKEIKEGAPPRLTLEQLGAGFAKTVVAAMVAGVSPNDPDVLFDKKANARVIDGDFYQQQFDPEETVAMLRLAFREHGWDDFKPVFKDALVKAIAEAAVPDHKRRNLRDAVDVF
jgi:hypothetical protein